MRLFFYYFLLFFIYSCFGWIVETINCSITEKRKVLNRGFLIGPYIPIYGTGAIIMVLFLNEYKEEPFVLFCMAVVYCSIIEYITSYIMEKLFSARWWDYSNYKLNINGRICLKNSLLFGLLGIVLIYGLHPIIEHLLLQVPDKTLVTISYTVFVIFILDILVTLIILSKLDIQINNIKSDATEEIDKEVKKIISHYRILYKRLFKAFPKIKFNIERGNILIEKIRKEFDDIDDMLAKNKEEIAKLKKELKKLKINKSNEVINKEEKVKLQNNLRKVRKRKV